MNKLATASRGPEAVRVEKRRFPGRLLSPIGWSNLCVRMLNMDKQPIAFSDDGCLPEEQRSAERPQSYSEKPHNGSSARCETGTGVDGEVHASLVFYVILPASRITVFVNGAPLQPAGQPYWLMAETDDAV